MKYLLLVCWDADRMNTQEEPDRPVETDEDEGWIDYIHDHEHGVKVYRCDREAIGSDAPIERVPAWLKNTRELTWLGKLRTFFKIQS